MDPNIKVCMLTIQLLDSSFVTGFFQCGDQGSNETEALPQGWCRDCKIAAWARPAISCAKRALLKEHIYTICSCWFWIILESASNQAQSNTPKQNFLIKKEVIHLVFKKQQLWKSTKTPKVYW